MAVMPERDYSEDMTDRSPAADDVGGEEVDSFDRELEAKIHTYIAAAVPTDGPAPAG